MVLKAQDFKLHRSLRKSLKHFITNPRCEIRFDSAFEAVINACAYKPREGQPGTWIVPDMVKAYNNLHQDGHAHSVETWVDDELVGGLYCVNLGGMVFGESMFAHQTDASKIALSALVAFCRAKNITLIDCQQNTRHLASLGAAEISREDFISHIQTSANQPEPAWRFEPIYWNEVLTRQTQTQQ